MAKNNQDIPFFCFTNLKNIEKLTEIQKNFFLHPLDQKTFHHKVAKGRGLITTAGFESVCEAAYIGKPVMMLPMHVEQELNGADANFFGIGIVQTEPDLDAFMDFTSKDQEIKEASLRFRNWEANLEDKFIPHIKEFTHI